MTEDNDLDGILTQLRDNREECILSAQAVNNLLAQRVSDSKKQFYKQYINELVIIAACIAAICLNYLYVPTVVRELGIVHPQYINLTFLITLAYYVFSIGMFSYLSWLFNASSKGMDNRSYISKLTATAKLALAIYFWVSTVITVTIMVLQSSLFFSVWQWWFLLLMASGSVGIYYLNRWYIQKRFGKQMQALYALNTTEG